MTDSLVCNGQILLLLWNVLDSNDPILLIMTNESSNGQY